MGLIVHSSTVQNGGDPATTSTGSSTAELPPSLSQLRVNAMWVFLVLWLAFAMTTGNDGGDDSSSAGVVGVREGWSQFFTSWLAVEKVDDLESLMSDIDW
ncbi:hypothetical protein PIB30_066571 [Stylosanthes scabra]|uniref:Uncharacterized protein n=1 Tax=Stylosanthes scabra TaxID=79078 RepID=A0ABU6RMW7_9FABA|nr:hypothetical protein [Stylosanthes scabra]